MRNMMVIATGVNVQPLSWALKRQPWLWNTNTERTAPLQSPHNQVDDIWVRFNPTKNTDEPHFSEWYPAWYALPELKPIVFDLMRQVEGEQLGGILITRIPPGKRVLPHVDFGWHSAYYDKYIVQVESSPEQSFNFEEEALFARPGDIYWFDNSKNHWVDNPSKVDRISLIVCIKNNRQKVAV